MNDRQEIKEATIRYLAGVLGRTMKLINSCSKMVKYLLAYVYSVTGYTKKIFKYRLDMKEIIFTTMSVFHQTYLWQIAHFPNLSLQFSKVNIITCHLHTMYLETVTYDEECI